MKVVELRSAIGERGVGWADLIEKSELAARLAELKARASLFSASGALSPGRVVQVNAEQLRQEMSDRRTPLLIDVFATWCGPCKMIAPQLDAIAAKAGDKLRIAKLDSDAEDALSAELRVSGLPTLIFMRDGNEVRRLEGMPEAPGALEGLVTEVLGVAL